MDSNKVAQAWEMALRQFVDTDSPFGQARLVSSVCLLLLAVLASAGQSGLRLVGWAVIDDAMQDVTAAKLSSVQ